MPGANTMSPNSNSSRSNTRLDRIELNWTGLESSVVGQLLASQLTSQLLVNNLAGQNIGLLFNFAFSFDLNFSFGFNVMSCMFCIHYASTEQQHSSPQLIIVCVRLSVWPTGLLAN